MTSADLVIKLKLRKSLLTSQGFTGLGEREELDDLIEMASHPSTSLGSIKKHCETQKMEYAKHENTYGSENAKYYFGRGLALARCLSFLQELQEEPRRKLVVYRGKANSRTVG